MNRRDVSCSKIAALLLLFAFTMTLAQGHQKDFQARSHKSRTVTMVYRLFVPKNYIAAKKYPIVVALHGIGERGSDNNAQIDREDLIWPWILDSIQNRVPHFIMVPQCPSNETWGGMGGAGNTLAAPAQGVIEILDSLKREFSLDTNRFYITGLSLGGAGTYHLLELRPGLFAAAVPCAAGGNTSAAATIAKTPFWAFQGSLDGNPPGNRRMADAVEAKGIKVVRFVSECAITSPGLSSYRDAVNRGANAIDLVAKNPSGISYDSLKRTVIGGADHLYSELTGGDHRSGWMIAYHHPLLAAWVFSKTKGGMTAASLVSTPGAADSHKGRATSTAFPGMGDRIVAYSLTGQKLSSWDHRKGLQLVLEQREDASALRVMVMDRKKRD